MNLIENDPFFASSCYHQLVARLSVYVTVFGLKEEYRSIYWSYAASNLQRGC